MTTRGKIPEKTWQEWLKKQREAEKQRQRDLDEDNPPREWRNVL